VSQIKPDLSQWIRKSFDISNEEGFTSFADFQIVFTSPIRTFRGSVAGFGADTPVPALEPLQAQLSEAVKRGPAVVFLLHSPDNADTLLKWIRPFQWQKGELQEALQAFEKEAAPQGGTNQLGVLAADKTWMLHFEYMPYDAFEIKVFGSSQFCQQFDEAEDEED
jgi:hypothetical protein